MNAGTRWDQLQVGAQLSLYRELPIETRPNVAVIPAPESEAKLVEKVAEKIADKAAATTLESLRDQKTLPQSLNVLNREQESLKPINDETPAEPHLSQVR